MNQLIRLEPGIVDELGRVEIIVKYNGDIERVGVELNAEVEILNENYAIITINVDNIASLQAQREVEYIELPKTLVLFLRQSLSKACISSVQSPESFGLSGNGVIVGIIDSGIDFTHPDFRNIDGTSRILYLWDQSFPGAPPTGFTIGTEYTNSEINEALNSEMPYSVIPSSDFLGHGTAVAGIAAGNGRVQRGVAPQASLIIVKLGDVRSQTTGRSTDIMRAIKYIIDRAEALNMPVSINLSYGTNNGAHDGNSLFETYIDDMAERWKTVFSVATGNEGSAGHHFEVRLQQGETVEVEIATTGNIDQAYMTLWKNFVDTITLELISPSGRSTGIMSPIQNATYKTLDGVFVSVIYGQPTHYTTNQEVYFSLNATTGTIPAGVWRLIMRGENIVDGRVNIWLPTIEDVTRDTTFLRPSEETTLTIPSTAQRVISVGGYNALIEISPNFSGRGYTLNDVFVKPDLVAPAVNINTAKVGGGYDSFTGTSMAAPFVAGSAALMMEWGIIRGHDPFLYGQRVKAFLQKGAQRQFPIPYPNPIWGYGTLSLCTTMDYLVEYTSGGGITF
ncbi:S8 family serine peptidase [Clostridium aminobutyricum]|uniref:S8 family serine peptidase n=1 Tax=Clostridium aminobutyricum TaxID=33953 RepID=A0A939IH51_CLOAM|nr:S8 family serine peptidase [Clostridium aminobutyricum]